MLTREDVIRMDLEAGSIAVGEAADQIRALHAAGYWMARLTPAGVSLPMEHYRAVCAGAVRPTQPGATPGGPQMRPHPQRVMASGVRDGVARQRLN